MKKYVLMLVLATVIFAAGCGNEDANALQTSPTTEESKIEINTEIDTDAEDATDSIIENTNQQNEDTESNILSSSETIDGLDDYITPIKEQSDIIKASLEGNDTLKQSDMNVLSQELYELWDDALNYLWYELKNSLPKEEFSKLLDEQLIWIAEKEKAVEEAGKEVKGGSIYPLVVNMAAAEITEERVYDLYELMK